MSALLGLPRFHPLRGKLRCHDPPRFGGDAESDRTAHPGSAYPGASPRPRSPDGLPCPAAPRQVAHRSRETFKERGDRQEAQVHRRVSRSRARGSPGRSPACARFEPTGSPRAHACLKLLQLLAREPRFRTASGSAKPPQLCLMGVQRSARALPCCSRLASSPTKAQAGDPRARSARASRRPYARRPPAPRSRRPPPGPPAPWPPGHLSRVLWRAVPESPGHPAPPSSPPASAVIQAAAS